MVRLVNNLGCNFTHQGKKKKRTGKKNWKKTGKKLEKSGQK
jgi:hypothetical protein